MILGVQSELEPDDRAVDALDGKGENHVEDEELPFKTVWNVVTTSSRVVHSTHVGEIFDAFEVSSLSFVKPVESSLFNELSDNFEGDLVAPLVHEGHAHVVDEDSHQFVLWRTVFFAHLVIALLLN